MRLPRYVVLRFLISRSAGLMVIRFRCVARTPRGAAEAGRKARGGTSDCEGAGARVDERGETDGE